MIIITGASGHYGRAVAERLLEFVPAAQIGVSVRDPEKVQDLAERGVRVRPGDFTDPDGLRHTFESASQVLIVSVNVLGPEAVKQHGSAIAAAKAAGAGRILYTSQIAASPDSAFAPARDHAETEALLQASGVPFTSLRNGYYAESALWQLGNARKTHKLSLPEDGPVSWTTRSDLADAAVSVLTNPAALEGITPPLASPKALDFAALARMASEIVGEPVTREVVADDAFRTSLVTSGLSEAMADGVLGSFIASRRGEFTTSNPTLERLLGRAVTPIHGVLTGFFSQPDASHGH